MITTPQLSGKPGQAPSALQQRVRGFVQGGLRGLRGREVGVDDDAAGAVDGGVAVRGAGDLLALDAPPARGEERGDRVHDTQGVVSGEVLHQLGRVRCAGGVGSV